MRDRLLPEIGVASALLLAAVLALVFWRPVEAQDMDLPLPPVRVGDPVPERLHLAPPTPDEAEGDDPRDTPPPVFYGEEIDTETDSIIYVIDISSSMVLDGRMERARTETIRSFSALPDSYTFNVIAYSSVTYPCFTDLAEATADAKAQAVAWLMNFNPHAFTATGPATALALQERENGSVVLLTDGFPNYGIPLVMHPNTPPAQQILMAMEAHRRVIRDANTHGATVDVFGIAATGDMRAFCQAVASDNGGRFVDVP